MPVVGILPPIEAESSIPDSLEDLSTQELISFVKDRYARPELKLQYFASGPAHVPHLTQGCRVGIPNVNDYSVFLVQGAFWVSDRRAFIDTGQAYCVIGEEWLTLGGNSQVVMMVDMNGLSRQEPVLKPEILEKGGTSWSANLLRHVRRRMKRD